MKKGMVKALLAVLIVGLWPVDVLSANPATGEKVGSIEGTVIDRSTRRPLPSANVMIAGTTMSDAGDCNGDFLIENVPVGIYCIEASVMGYQAGVKTEIVVSTNRVTMVNFELNPTVLQLLEEVVITAEYFKMDSDTPVSTRTLTAQEICFSPGAIEDIFRVVQSMPGVNSAGEMNSNLIVRGGAPGENRTLLENIESGLST